MRSSRLFVRVDGDPAAAIPMLLQELSHIDPNVHVGQVMPLIERTRMSFESERMLGTLLSATGLVGLVLSVLGLYGSIAFAVARRRRELGVRSALGAGFADIVYLVLAGGLKHVVAGLVIGAVAAHAASGLLAARLYGIEGDDPRTYAVVALVLGVVALVASAVPAVRAARTDPALALRYE